MTGDFTPWGARKKTLGWIEDENGCHIWTGARTIAGYALANIDYRVTLVHRHRYEREIGPIPDGLVLDHYVCDNGAGGCVNPHHCRPVTNRKNAIRGARVVASFAPGATHCAKGHPATPENLRRSDLRRGRRVCRECRKEVDRANYRRRRMREGHTSYRPMNSPLCKRGLHPLAGDNLDSHGLKRGWRVCRACMNARNIRRYHERKQAK